MSQSSFLLQHGYLLIALDKDRLDRGIQLYKEYLSNIPEHLPGTFQAFHSEGDIGAGSFGALNLPSAFHCPAKRYLNSVAYEAVVPILQPIAQQLKLKYLQGVPDRFLYRTKKQPRQSYHTDNTMHAKATDVFYASQMNLNDDLDHVFTLVPGTHKLSARVNGGEYTPLVPSDELRRKEKSVTIPPGHLLLFNENIVHRITGRKPPKPLLRNGFGFRITNDTEDCYKENARLFAEQGTLVHKGGKVPPSHPKLWLLNHSHLFANYNKRLIPEMLEEHTFKSGKKAGQTIVKPKNPQPSLTVLGKRYRDYTEAELAIYKITRI